MPTAKKLPSGNYRVRVFTHKDEDGKNHYKSFTAATKKEAEMLALNYKYAEPKNIMTFEQALNGYIESREDIISPSTLKEYKRSAKNDFVDLLNLDIESITQEDIQSLINNHAKTKAPKTIRNIHGLLSGVFQLYRPTFKLKTTLPQKDPEYYYVPTENDIKTIMEYTKKNDIEMYYAILLAAFGPLRRSEICALTSKDFDGSVINIKGAVVNSEEGWVDKKPKTTAGNRPIPLPDFVYNELKNRKGRIVNLKPNMISDRFIDIVNRCKLEHFTFHSLRHYCASYLHAIGMPDIYIMERCGWDSDTPLKKIYRHALQEQSKKFNDDANKKFSEMYANF